MAGSVQETRKFWRHPCFSDLTMLKARFTRHRYDLHTHPAYVVALVTEGCERLRIGRHSVIAPTGSIILVNPEECHDGEAGAENGWAYRTFYPPIPLMTTIAAELGFRHLPLFSTPLLRDVELSRAVAVAHESAASDDILTAEASMILALRQLILRHGDRAPRHEHVETTGSRRRISLYLDLIDQALAGGIGLERLAQAAGVTRFQVIRDFRRETGLTPGSFIRNRRVRRAAMLLRKGENIAAAAAAAGFSDQSHLTRAFNAVFGITPRIYQQASRER